MKKRLELLQYASGIFLSEELPNEWPSLSEEDQNNFLEEFAVIPWEYTPPKELLEFITDEADRLEKFIDDRSDYDEGHKDGYAEAVRDHQ